MTAQTKSLVVGGATVAVAKWYLQKDWKTAAIYGVAALVAYIVISDLPES